MKRVKAAIAIIISTCFLLGLSGCGLISKTPEAEQKTAVATVNGVKITVEEYQKELNQQIQQIEAQYGTDFFTKQPQYLATVKDKMLEQLIQKQVMLYQADKQKMVVDDKTVAAAVTKQIASDVKALGGQKKYEEQLKSVNLTAEKYKSTLTTDLKDNLTLQKLMNSITDKAKVSDQDVINYYWANEYNYTEKPDTMNVSHILLKTLPEAQKVAKEIKAGLKFEDAAKKYGTDGTKTSGGSLGDVKYTDLYPEFVAGAVKLPLGKVSDPVKSSAGYHLIKVKSRKEYKLKSIDSVKAEISKTLLDNKKNELLNTAYAKWEKECKIVKHTDEIK